VFIVIVLLLIVLPLLFAIHKLQKKNIEALDNATKSVERFNYNVTELKELISSNFQSAFAKLNVLDSRQISIGDVVKDISGNLELYSNKAITAIGAITKASETTSFKPVSDTQPNKRSNGRRKQNNGS